MSEIYARFNSCEIDEQETTSYRRCSFEKPEHLEKELIYFVLEHKYDKSSLSFSKLEGQDHVLAQLLQSCSFLDVHLAVIIQHVWKQEDEKDEYADMHFKIGDWINSQNIHIDLPNLQVNFKSQIIGDILKLTNPVGEPDVEDEKPDSDYERIIMVNREYHHTILVAWPKQRTSTIYLNYSFNSFLRQLERQVLAEQMPFSHSVSRDNTIMDLQTILEFCLTRPLSIWLVQEKENEEPSWRRKKTLVKEDCVALRLLKLCIHLRAKTEGLTLLNLLAEGEGIRNVAVAEAIAELECQLIGNYNVYIVFHRHRE